MVKAKVEPTKNLVVVEEDIYDATFEGVEEAVIKLPDGTEREVWQWNFNIEYEGETVTIQGVTTRRFTPRSKAYKWLSAIAGREFEVGEEIDFDEFIGQPCRIIVENKELRNGGEISRVVDVKRARKKRKVKKKEAEDEE